MHTVQEAQKAAQQWLESTARLAGPHGVSRDQEAMMRLGFEEGFAAAHGNRSWWTSCTPNQSLDDANEEIGWMREDWQMLGEALGFKEHVDPEYMLARIATLRDPARVDEAMVDRALTALRAYRGTYEGEVPIEADDIRVVLSAALLADGEAAPATPPPPQKSNTETKMSNTQEDNRPFTAEEIEQRMKRLDEIMRGFDEIVYPGTKTFRFRIGIVAGSILFLFVLIHAVIGMWVSAGWIAERFA